MYLECHMYCSIAPAILRTPPAAPFLGGDALGDVREQLGDVLAHRHRGDDLLQRRRLTVLKMVSKKND